MPFTSQSQARFFADRKPKLFKEFARKTLSIKKLPDKVRKGSKHNSAHGTGHKTFHN